LRITAGRAVFAAGQEVCVGGIWTVWGVGVLPALLPGVPLLAVGVLFAPEPVGRKEQALTRISRRQRKIGEEAEKK